MLDRTKTTDSARARIILESPIGEYSFQLDFDCSNNQVEYKALIIGLQLLVELKVRSIKILGEFQLVIKQLNGEYSCSRK